MLAVIAKLPVQEDKLEEAIELIKGLIADVATEAGTLAYSMNIDKKVPSTIVIIERYKDQEALKIHGSTDHFKAFFGKIGGLLAGKPEINYLDEIASI